MDSNCGVSLVKKLPDKSIQFFWVDMNKEFKIINLENSLNEMKYKGLKIHQAWTPFDIESKKFQLLIDFAGKEKLPIFIHPYKKKDMSKLIKIISNNKKVNFIIAHLMGF